MRLRLLRRMLTVSAPRVAVHSAMPWPLRWLMAALVLGFSGSLALWAFETGKEIAGLDRHAKEELVSLRAEVQQLRAELQKAQSVANTAGSLITTEKAAQEQLVQQIRQLQADNQSLRRDLGFFERLIPDTGKGDLSIRGLQVDRLAEGQWKWQVLMIQAAKNAPEFVGQLEIILSGTSGGKPWSLTHKPEPDSVVIRSYLRQEGVVAVPPQVQVHLVTARVMQNGALKSVQSIKP